MIINSQDNEKINRQLEKRADHRPQIQPFGRPPRAAGPHPEQNLGIWLQRQRRPD